MQNIIKHSGADTITVDCCYGDQLLQITITDNGKGFNKSNIKQQDGLGLLNMVQRAALIGGEARIESVLTKGTTVTIVAPYT